MTENGLVRIVELHSSSIDELIEQISVADNLGLLNEARARIEALRAWGKVHGTVQKLRLDLLRVEAEALVRIVELGGADTLRPADRKAAEWLAELSPVERSKFIREAKTATTVRGMCQAVWREREDQVRSRHHREQGRDLAKEPSPPPPFDQDAIRLAEERAHSVAGVLSQIARGYITNGVEFTVEEMADEIISDAALSDDLATNDAIVAGVREVCQQVVRSSPPLSIDGTTIPRLLTARFAGSASFVRIPTMNATIAHLDDAIALRKIQIQQDLAALRRLEDFAQRMKTCPGSGPNVRIGKLIADLILITSEEKQ